MAVVGGAGYILGPVVGTFLLNLLGRLLPAQEAQGLFYGGALIVILVIAPEGLLGWIHRRIESRAVSKAESSLQRTSDPESKPRTLEMTR